MVKIFYQARLNKNFIQIIEFVCPLLKFTPTVHATLHIRTASRGMSFAFIDIPYLLQYTLQSCFFSYFTLFFKILCTINRHSQYSNKITRRWNSTCYWSPANHFYSWSNWLHIQPHQCHFWPSIKNPRGWPRYTGLLVSAINIGEGWSAVLWAVK